ncbi:helix-turn-helix transcriptional regulator [Pectobacterium atrosepticum]|uniref:helix-turn-helix transcriptional regulator n=1 Tax=Pectobacterium atrosepticum TaxID=29471 RepID=UPI0005047167|nr:MULTISPECIES: PAS and helix-turn-helix domain-containing protein [Pectobacterium]KFX11041.1 LuxR family transcriptional regulator [Pectobacterium atrosepticum]KMK87597.1 LuxR family transcriptional regulator [Pectobacterium atrosepticum ICMP 1526]MCL6336339.1 helix-turn-helix transcriptional regulator [Pectobacterium carotovorum subsp. carotovorum]QXE13115.1 helix-turn-helix transcriptional regulator [Pectobacterium atrosepticum]
MESLGGIISTLDNLREPWGIKNLDSQHIYMNAAAYAYTNTPTHFNVEGKHDAEFPVGWSEFAGEMVEHDRRAEESQERVTVIETYNWFNSTELVPYLCEKIPLFSDKKSLIGTLWTSRSIRTISPVYLSAKQRAPVAEWTSTYEGPFTKTEMETLFLLLCDFSKTDIAEKMNLSKRTIDNRIQRMYQKIGVHNLRQFEEYCYQHGLQGYIPQSFLKKGSVFL